MMDGPKSTLLKPDEDGTAHQPRIQILTFCNSLCGIKSWYQFILADLLQVI